MAAFDDLELHVITADRTRDAVSHGTWEGVLIHRLPWTGRKVLTYATGAGRRQMREYLTRMSPDVIHSHDVYGLMLKGLPLPRVFTIHGFVYGDTF